MLVLPSMFSFILALATRKKCIWQMASIAIMWSIWRIRNRVAFQHDNLDEDGCFEWCCCDLVWWVKAKWGEQVPYMVNIPHDPNNIEIRRKLAKCRRLWV